MRVASGVAKRARLRGPGRGGVRPTSDRVKDALMNILAPRLADARVLDLFAGTGALGIEALSRGAKEAVFVERDRQAAAMIQANLEATGFGDRGTVRRANVLTEIAALAKRGNRFDLIVLDPPYGLGLQARTVRLAARAGLLAPGGLVVAEGHWRDDPGAVDGLRCTRTARYGETALWFYEEET